MIRYHLVEIKEDFRLVKKAVSAKYADAVYRRLSGRHPERNYKVVSVTFWNEFLKSLDDD